MTLALRWKICIGQSFFLTAGKRCSTDYSTQRRNKLLEMPTTFLKLEIIAACIIWKVEIKKNQECVVGRQSSVVGKTSIAVMQFPILVKFRRSRTEIKNLLRPVPKTVLLTTYDERRATGSLVRRPKADDRRRASPHIHHQQPRLSHVLDRIPQALAAKTGVLHTAIRHVVNAEAGNIAGDNAADF